MQQLTLKLKALYDKASSMTKKNPPACKVVSDLGPERLSSAIYRGAKTHGCTPKVGTMVEARSKGYQILRATRRAYLIN